MAAVIFLSVIIALGVYLWSREEEKIVGLQRKTSGEGSYTEELQVTIEGQKGSTDFQVEVPEQKYAEETVDKHLKEAAEKLEKIVLAENESFNNISKDLNFITHVPDTGIRVTWSVSDYSVLDRAGHIVETQEKKEKKVELLAELAYGEHKTFWKKEAVVCPPKQTKDEKMVSKLAEVLAKCQEETETEETFILPTEIEGRKLIWRRRKDTLIFYILAAGIVLAVLIPARRIQEEKQEEKKRGRELERGYPDLVRRFQLYIGAGMSVRNAFLKLDEDYRREQENQYVQEEISRIIRENKSGISEAQCYEMFGERCGLPAYRKFGTILSQNLRKGTKGIGELLQKEAEEAFEDRKAFARRRGEEAATKMLFPMFLMLGTVMIMVIVPAFMSMQL